jgi:hypothetical protein
MVKKGKLAIGFRLHVCCEALQWDLYSMFLTFEPWIDVAIDLIYSIFHHVTCCRLAELHHDESHAIRSPGIEARTGPATAALQMTPSQIIMCFTSPIKLLEKC